MDSEDIAKLHSNILETERIAHLVRLAARGFNRSLSRRLAEHDISFGQWTFLRILWKHEGLTQREISDIAQLTEPTVHTALSKLEQQGIIERRKVNENKRKLYVFLTEEGWRLRDILEPLAIEANEVALEGLSDRENSAFRRMLVKILDNLARDEERALFEGIKVPATRSMRLDG